LAVVVVAVVVVAVVVVAVVVVAVVVRGHWWCRGGVVRSWQSCSGSGSGGHGGSAVVAVW